MLGGKNVAEEEDEEAEKLQGGVSDSLVPLAPIDESCFFLF